MSAAIKVLGAVVGLAGTAAFAVHNIGAVVLAFFVLVWKPRNT